MSAPGGTTITGFPDLLLRDDLVDAARDGAKVRVSWRRVTSNTGWTIVMVEPKTRGRPVEIGAGAQQLGRRLTRDHTGVRCQLVEGGYPMLSVWTTTW